MSHEWLNAIGKKGGGIVSITKTPSALSYNMRAHIAASTQDMFHLGLDDEIVHNESTKARTQQVNMDESAILDALKRFNVLGEDASPIQFCRALPQKIWLLVTYSSHYSMQNQRVKIS